MSRIDDLIKELALNGVEFVTLAGVAKTMPGLSGKTKADFSDGNARFVSYKNVFANLAVDQNAPVFVKVGADEKQNRLHQGDVIFTGSSETADEVGMSSVVMTEPSEPLYLNSFCFAVRFDDPTLVLPGFSKYLFRSDSVRSQIRRTASGVTRINISKHRFMKVRIPVPPLEVQREIVRILDKFTQLEAELEAELEARRRQYSFYRDSLLIFPEAGVRRIPMGDAGTFFGGLTGKSKADFSDGNARFVSYVNVFKNIAVNLQAGDFVRVEPGERQRLLQRGDILFTGSSETPQEVGMSSVVTTDTSEPTYLNSFSIGYRLNEPGLLDPEFAKHLFRSTGMRQQFVRTASGVTRFNVSKVRLAKVVFPVPPKDEQTRIARVLDKFELLVNDLSVGLPAELVARRKQYEHYRDRLLTFEEAEA